jgi:hypothetical protein
MLFPSAVVALAVSALGLVQFKMCLEVDGVDLEARKIKTPDYGT